MHVARDVRAVLLQRLGHLEAGLEESLHRVVFRRDDVEVAEQDQRNPARKRFLRACSEVARDFADLGDAPLKLHARLEAVVDVDGADVELEPVRLE
ncbi:MAG TPA: hypothetical protein VF063_07630 [Gaiellaceae bacterium]